MIDVNVQQGKSPLWRDKKCARCGRTPAEATLNIEAIIHHNARELECVDRKDCQKVVKKKGTS